MPFPTAERRAGLDRPASTSPTGSGRGLILRRTNSVPRVPDIQAVPVLVGAARRDLGRIKSGRECEALSRQIVARLPYLGPKDPEGEQRQADRLSKCG
jgi:hypothetical protein